MATETGQLEQVLLLDWSQSLFGKSDPLAISLSNDGIGDFLSVNLSVIFGGIQFAYEDFAFSTRLVTAN